MFIYLVCAALLKKVALSKKKTIDVIKHKWLFI